ncbi:molybdopterin molybdenumtransferase MoeA [Actinomycetospora sp. NBRC 106375]|uniref:molybdopterin molybdotransferase MoeA n=1 Tax=Actinomycetospora sp. NBRC 106375 TaxID=3032207 RepID=UPI0024A30456|nr:molybdopterin molybdotransferase MoeA [Actinomycetospora sp. NBRC 106375]GLZ50343.1 molybdopterin molybdenumtransferase MoeA [Actinomycetospora sp. NBRC 106375]
MPAGVTAGAPARGGHPAPDAALQRWLRAAGRHPARGPVSVPVDSAVGRVLAAPVHARRSSPWFTCAAMDGVAVRTDDVRAEGAVTLGARRSDVVDTGDLVPAGSDTVVPVEDVESCGDGVTLRGPVTPGCHVRAIGEDVVEGSLMLPAGHRLRPQDLAAVAATGHRTLLVHHTPRVTVIPTGDELRPLGAALAQGEITESNSIMLAARLRELGARPSVTGIVADRPCRLVAALRDAATAADVLVVLAGSSAGRDDHTASVVDSCGETVVHGVAMRPGHPTVLGVLWRGGTTVPVLGLPGYPVAAAIALEVFGVAMLATLEGGAARPEAFVEAVLQRTVHSSLDVEEWVRVRVEDGPLAVSMPGGASVLSGLVAAHGLLRVPAGVGEVAAGTSVRVRLFGGDPPS